MLISYKKANIDQADGMRVLNNVDFSVEDGAFIYIIGRVGSGKSSLLKTIYCELDIEDAEEAIVLGQDIMTIRRRDIPTLRRQIGIVFQDFQLLADRSVYKNLDFVLQATDWKDQTDRHARIGEVLRLVGMVDKQDKMPHELSGGEQQRIAIARAILNSPKLIVADEPTGNLDPETANGIMQLFMDIAKGGTAVVMSTHNMPLLDRYPGIVYRCYDSHMDEITGDYQTIKIEEKILSQ